MLVSNLFILFVRKIFKKAVKLKIELVPILVTATYTPVLIGFEFYSLLAFLKKMTKYIYLKQLIQFEHQLVIKINAL